MVDAGRVEDMADVVARALVPCQRLDGIGEGGGLRVLAMAIGQLAGANRSCAEIFAQFVRVAAGVGPDVGGPADSFEQTQDFRVSFDAPVEAAGA